MPNLKRLASSGLIFDDAICASPLCAPSRVSMATGRSYGRAPSEGDEPLALGNFSVLPRESDNFYRRLSEAGYSVASCGKSDLRKKNDSWGPDGLHMEDGISLWHAMGFTHGADCAGKHDAIWAHQKGIPDPYFRFLEEHGVDKVHMADFAGRPYPNFTNTEPTDLPQFAYADNYVAATALRLIREMSESEQPWFLQVNFMGPHEPLDVTPAMKESVAGRDVPMDWLASELDEETQRDLRRNYMAMLENIDRRLGEIFASLEAQGLLANTIVVYASDHGEMLGERDEWTKIVPYAASVSVPLVISGPGVSNGRFSECVSLVDLAPTFLEIAEAAPLDETDGQSLVPTFTDANAEIGGARLCGLGGWRSLVTEDWRLIVGYEAGTHRKDIMASRWDGTMSHPMLFDRKNDPREKNNVAAKHPHIVTDLFARLSELASSGPPASAGS